MAWRLATVALLSAPAAAELQCMGRLAHEVTSSPETGDFLMRPMPERDDECLVAWPSLVGDHVFCIGTNKDETCTHSAVPVLDFPGDTQCKDCFVAGKMDVWYDVEISGFRLQKLAFGLRNTTITQRLMLSHGDASKAREGSRSFLPDEKSFAIHGLPNITLQMPTTISYKLSGGLHKIDGLGAELDITIPDMRVEYVPGKGLEHVFDKPTFKARPLTEGELPAIAGNLEMDIESNLSFSLSSSLIDVKHTAAFSSHIPLANTVSTDLRGVKDCLQLGLHFDLTQQSHVGLHLAMLSHDFDIKPSTWNFDKTDVVNKCIEKSKAPPAVEQEAVVV